MRATPDRDDRQAVLARLARAQKSNRGAAGYSRWVNRPLGRQLAVIAYLAGLTPNQVSLLSAACTYTAIALVALVTPALVVVVVITGLLLFGYALDSADGQVARLRGGGSPAGEWLDHVLDAVKVCGFHLAVAIAWFRFYDLDTPAWLLVPLGYCLVASVFFFSITLSDMLRRIARQQAGGSAETTARVSPDEAAPVLRSLLVLPNDYGLLCVVMVLLAWRSTFTIVYTLLFAANAVFLVVGCLRWFREMESLGRAVPNR